MIDVDQVLEVPLATEQGKKKTVGIMVDFVGTQAEKGDATKYRFGFSGVGVDPVTGQVSCPGEDGQNPNNHYRITFQVSPGTGLEMVTFSSPLSGCEFEFEVGVGICSQGSPGLISQDETEFGDVKLAGGKIKVHNKKKNSNSPLSYQFRVWVTHDGDSTQWGVPYDPRIINN